MKKKVTLAATFLITAAILSSCATTKQSTTDNNIPVETTSTDNNIPVETTSTDNNIPVETTSTDNNIPVEATSTDNNIPVEATSTDNNIPVKTTSTDNNIPVKTTSTDNNIPVKTTSIHQKIIGEWYDKNLQYNFNKDGYATLTFGNQVMGGTDLFAESALKYELDDTKDPITLDLIHLDKSTGKIRNTMPMIIKFINDNHLMIRSFMTRKRPEAFVEGDDEFTVTFVRRK